MDLLLLGVLRPLSPTVTAAAAASLSLCSSECEGGGGGGPGDCIVLLLWWLREGVAFLAVSGLRLTTSGPFDSCAYSVCVCVRGRVQSLQRRMYAYRRAQQVVLFLVAHQHLQRFAVGGAQTGCLL